MKNIILDCFRRWRIPLSVLLIAYFVFQSLSFREANGWDSAMGKTFSAQIVMSLGLLLIYDSRRGIARAMTILPLTTKQIGRSLWLASVLLPALALLAATLLAFVLFSAGANRMMRLEDHLTYWLLAALYFGGIYGALTLMPVTAPDTFAGKALMAPLAFLWPVTIFGSFLAQMETLITAKAILIFIFYLILSVTGWFRAEQIVRPRVAFRPGERHSTRRPAHKTAQDFGGLSYLVQRTFIQSTLMGLGIFAITLSMSFLTRQIGAQAIISKINGGTTFYLFILLFSIAPIVFQLRFLRTLPISPSALAATFVFLPLISIVTIGTIVIVAAGLAFGGTVVLPSANSFLALAAEAAIVVSLIVWRGLDVLTYVLGFLLVTFDNVASLGLTMILHLSENVAERPVWMNLTVLLLCAAASFECTRRLILKSSNAYRVRTMPANIGGAPQR